MAIYHEIRYINKINIIVVSYNIGTYNIKKYLEEGEKERRRRRAKEGEGKRNIKNIIEI